MNNTSQSSSVPAGWYPSNAHTGKLQWWDGETWSDHLVSDFSPINIARLSKNEARAAVEDMARTIHQLEELVNQHGLRRYEEFEVWKAGELERIAERSNAANALQVSAGAALHAANLEAQEIIARAEATASIHRTMTLKKLEEERSALETEVARLRAEVVPMREVAPMQEVGYFDYEHPAEASTALATELESVRSQIKDMIRSKEAATATTGLTFEGSAAKGKQLINNLTKILLRAYNAEAENAVKTTRAGNVDTAQARLSRAADQIAKNGQLINMRITSQFHRLRLKEIELANRHLVAVQREKELERERRAELREQRKAEQELQKEQERLEKERSHYLSTLAALESKGDVEGVQRIRERIADVERAIEDVDYRAANIRAGYVYVISNIGSFGPDVVKIGMTRRLDPLRVRVG